MRNRPLTLIIILYLLQLGVFLWIMLRPAYINPPDRTNNLLMGQGAYAAFILQAKTGAWKLYNPYTTRPSPTIYYHMLYVFLGKIAAIFSADPVFVYMAARIASGLILCIATYWFIRVVVPKSSQLLALLFALAIEPGPILTQITSLESVTRAIPAIFSYFPQEVALRHFGLPHHVLAEAVGLIMLGMVFLIVKKWSWNRLVIIGLTAAAGTLLMPAYGAVLVFTVLLVWGIWALAHKSVGRIILPFAVILLVIGAISLFTKSQMDLGYPMKDFNLDEKRWVTDGFLLINYVSSLLLYLPGALIFWVTLPFAWRRLDEKMKLLSLLLTVWVVGPLLYLPLVRFTFFPFANFRLVDGYAYVPMAILSALGLYKLFEAAKTRMVGVILVIILITSSLFLTVNYVRQVFADQQVFRLGANPLNTEWGAMRFLATVPHRSGVLVMQEFGELIPTYAMDRVFLGETPGQVDWQERYFEAADFYSGKLTEPQAAALMSRENISYVWWGAAEKAWNTNLDLLKAYPTLLAPVYQTPDISVFRVRQ